jgi:hypothetical protein
MLPNETPIQKVQVFVFQGWIENGVTLATHLHVMPRLQIVEHYLYSFIHLRELAVNESDIGTTLPFQVYSYNSVALVRKRTTPTERATCRQS